MTTDGAARPDRNHGGKKSMAADPRMRRLTAQIYGSSRAEEACRRLELLLADFPPSAQRPAAFFSERDAVLISYADSLCKEGEAPLAGLHRFARKYLKGAFNAIHCLPFFPASSDDGFSVLDFFSVDPQLGDWGDIGVLGSDFGLMFDFVINHFSAQGDWFAAFLDGREGFEAFAIEVDPAEDLSGVTRPRSLPLLTAFVKSNGRPVHLWTTFSADQIDFNFASLEVLEKMVAVMLHYVRRGARILRLDAIAYLWKEIGTSCIHLPQTHAVVKLLRHILDRVAPEIMLVTETNVPHAENISYFGDGRDEAQMVYNFALPPLLLHAFATQDAGALSAWAADLAAPSAQTTFFNFTASHDGIGVRPLEGLLPDAEIDRLVQSAIDAGGMVSTRRSPDSSDSPYELNLTYVDAILGHTASERAEKFLASQAIQYCLPGVPATYIHSLLGSRNWTAGVRLTGRARTINREKLNLERVAAELEDPRSFRSRVFYPYRQLIRTRVRQPAFHPNADADILELDHRLFAVRRSCRGQTIYAVTNISPGTVHVPRQALGAPSELVDLVTGERWLGGRDLTIRPYQYAWLQPAWPC